MDEIPEVREFMRMHSKLTALAWGLLKIKTMEEPWKYTDQEKEFIACIADEALKFDVNINEVVDDILADPAMLPLAQAAMGDHIEKWSKR